MESECPLCLEIYDGTEVKPLIMPCGHTSCEACLRQSITQFNGLKCSICRKPHDRDISRFPVNFALIQERKANQESLESQGDIFRNLVKLQKQTDQIKEFSELVNQEFAKAADANYTAKRNIDGFVQGLETLLQTIKNRWALVLQEAIDKNQERFDNTMKNLRQMEDSRNGVIEDLKSAYSGISAVSVDSKLALPSLKPISKPSFSFNSLAIPQKDLTAMSKTVSYQFGDLLLSQEEEAKDLHNSQFNLQKDRSWQMNPRKPDSRKIAYDNPQPDVNAKWVIITGRGALEPLSQHICEQIDTGIAKNQEPIDILLNNAVTHRVYTNSMTIFIINRTGKEIRKKKFVLNRNHQ